MKISDVQAVILRQPVLDEGIADQARRGLERGYVPHMDDSAVIRGRIDIGATNARAAVVDAQGRILGSVKKLLEVRSPEAVVDAIALAASVVLAVRLASLSNCVTGNPSAGLFSVSSGIFSGRTPWRNCCSNCASAARAACAE